MIIDQLPLLGGDVQGTDELPIERGTTTYKTTVGEVVGVVSKIVADEYDNTSTYAVGDFCVYEGTLYVCNTDISTAEEWNASHWTATNVTDEIPTAYTSNPAMDGTASPGSSTSWAKGDHVHPHDTSKADTGLGITGASVDDFVKIAAVDANGKPTAFGKGTPGGGDVTADMLGIVIDGNSTPVGASAGQYVIVKNSTISGVTDGLYKAALAIPANTAIDATYLTEVSGGGLNSLEAFQTNKYIQPYLNGSASGITITVTFDSTYPAFLAFGINSSLIIEAMQITGAGIEKQLVGTAANDLNPVKISLASCSLTLKAWASITIISSKRFTIS